MITSNILRVKVHLLKTLFYILDYLSNFKRINKYVISGKLYIGSMIISLSMINMSCITNNRSGSGDNENETTPATDKSNDEDTYMCYDMPAPPPPPPPLPVDFNDKLDFEKDTLLSADQMPRFPGGADSLSSFITKNLVYPPIALKHRIEGNVFTCFTVSNKGEISGITVLQSASSMLDSEAIRLIKNMPKWIPGRQDNINVNVWCTLPIKFKIPNGK